MILSPMSTTLLTMSLIFDIILNYKEVLIYERTNKAYKERKGAFTGRIC